MKTNNRIDQYYDYRIDGNQVPVVEEMAFPKDSVVVGMLVRWTSALQNDVRWEVPADKAALDELRSCWKFQHHVWAVLVRDAAGQHAIVPIGWFNEPPKMKWSVEA